MASKKTEQARICAVKEIAKESKEQRIIQAKMRYFNSRTYEIKDVNIYHVITVFVIQSADIAFFLENKKIKENERVVSTAMNGFLLYFVISEREIDFEYEIKEKEKLMQMSRFNYSRDKCDHTDITHIERNIAFESYIYLKNPTMDPEYEDDSILAVYIRQIILLDTCKINFEEMFFDETKKKFTKTEYFHLFYPSMTEFYIKNNDKYYSVIISKISREAHDKQTVDNPEQHIKNGYYFLGKTFIKSFIVDDDYITFIIEESNTYDWQFLDDLNLKPSSHDFNDIRVKFETIEQMTIFRLNKTEIVDVDNLD